MPVLTRQHERQDDPQTWLGAAFRYANQQSPQTILALIIVGFLIWLYITKIDAMSADLRDHTHMSSYYQRQSCISLAVLSGTSTALCERPADDDRSGR